MHKQNESNPGKILKHLKMKKNTHFALLSVIISIMFVSCATIPQFTTVEKLTSLKPGMKKDKVIELLGIYPWDVYAMQADACEAYLYRYKHPAHKILFFEESKESGLTRGGQNYTGKEYAKVIFRDNKLETVFSDNGGKDYQPLVFAMEDMKDACDNLEGLIVDGCTDPNSINYDPDANMDDGSCEYCECGYILNPEREVNPNCAPCIPSEETKRANEKECDNCDIIERVIEQGNSSLDIRLNVGGHQEREGSIEKAKRRK